MISHNFYITTIGNSTPAYCTENELYLNGLFQKEMPLDMYITLLLPWQTLLSVSLDKGAFH